MKGKRRYIRTEDIASGPIRHDSLPDELLDRIRAIHSAIQDVYDTTLEQMELTFMRDLHPEQEVVIWENIVAAMGKVEAASPDLDRGLIFKTLLGYSLDALSGKQLSDPGVRRIVEIVEGE